MLFLSFRYGADLGRSRLVELSCDYDVELFTEPPRQGHVPLLLDISPLEYSKVINYRFWLEKADWASWTKTLEQLSEGTPEIDDCNEIWSRIKQSISEASDKFIPTKKIMQSEYPFLER